MKKFLFLSIIAGFIVSCSSDKPDTDKVVNEIKNAKNFTENITNTTCGDIKFTLEGNKIRHFYCDSYMGDGGWELNCYFYDNELIYCEYYSFYDGPMELEDGTFSTSGTAIGSKYKIYFEDENFAKCFKDDVETAELKPDYDPNPEKLVEFARKVTKAINTTDSEIMCDGGF